MTVTVTEKKNIGETRGTAAAAAALGVTRHHLRQVLLGRRQSPGLLARFEEWKKSGEATPVTVRVPLADEVATWDNFTEYFLKTLSILGLDAVLVTFKAGEGSPVFNHPDIAQELEKELKAIEAGQFDVSYFPDGYHWHIYHVDKTKLAAAMKRFKDAIAARELLPITRLFHVEDHTSMQEWWPGNAGALSIKEETP